MARRIVIALLASASLFVACGGDGNNSLDENLTVENVSPTGSVGGQILDGADDRPLSGVTVKVVAGSFAASATTDASGVFQITGVPASGTVLATFEKAGYLSAHQVGVFVNAAGNFPVDNATVTFGPLGLIPSDGSFSIYVFDDMGRPATGHLLTLTTRTRFLIYENGLPMNSGEISVTAQVGSSGLATFFNLPDYWALGEKADSWIDVAVPPYDQDDDGLYEFAGATYAYDLLNLGTPQPTILLESNYQGTLQIEASTLQALEGWPTSSFAPDAIPGVGPIHVLFNLPVDQESMRVSVWNEAGDTQYSASFQVNGRSASITFPTALPAGAEYNLLIVATAANGDHLATGSFSAPFFVINEGAAVMATVHLDDSLDPTNVWRVVEFSEPVGFGLPNVSLSAGNCVIFYDFFQIGPGGPGGNVTGDDAGELGNPSCYDPGNGVDFALFPDEPVPEQPAGAVQSGYTKWWRFQVPYSFGTLTQVPPNTAVHLIFNHVSTLSRIMRRVNGEPVPEIVITLPST